MRKLKSATRLCNIHVPSWDRAVSSGWSTSWSWSRTDLSGNRTACNPEQSLDNNVVVVLETNRFPTRKKCQGEKLEGDPSPRAGDWSSSSHTHSFANWVLVHLSAAMEIVLRRITSRVWNSAFGWVHFGTWHKWGSVAFSNLDCCGDRFYGRGYCHGSSGSVVGGSAMNRRNMVVLIGGILFGFGLSYSGMTKQEIVLSFLQLSDLGLIFVLGGAALVTALAINVVAKILKTPVLGGEFTPRRRILSWSTVIGAAIFGVGWGISGQCPGSAVASLGTGNFPVLVGLAAMFIGAYLRGLLDSGKDSQ